MESRAICSMTPKKMGRQGENEDCGPEVFKTQNEVQVHKYREKINER